MRNLIQFIWRYHFVLLFLLAELFAFAIIIQNNSFHRANFLGFTNELTGASYNKLTEATEYLELKEVNENLAAENARLRSEAKQSYFSLVPNVRFFDDSARMEQYEYMSAKVVNSSVGKRNNYLTLNVGDRKDVNSGMGVISDRGVIGVIKGTSTNYASVISLLHKDFQVGARLKSSQYFGILTWNGRDSKIGQLKDIPSHVALQKGDTLVTRGSGSIFPPDILLGVVRDFEEIEGTDFYSINIDLSVDFSNVNYVYVVRNKMKIEQQSLETENEEVAND